MVLLVSIFYTCYLLYFFIMRLPYPFELEWMEGDSLNTVWRILQNKKIYIEPVLEYIPNIYTPFYFHLSEFVTKIFGFNILVLRFISVISSILLFFLVYLFINRETGSFFFSLVGIGLMSTTFNITSGWYDLARVDNLFVFLLFLSVYLIRNLRSNLRIILSALILYLAFYTKQTSLFIFFSMTIFVLSRSPRKALYYGLAFLLPTVITFLVLNHNTDGWFYYYCFELPSQHALIKKYIHYFWTNEIFLKFGIPFIISIIYFIYYCHQKTKLLPSKELSSYLGFLRNDKITYHIFVFVSMLLISWTMRIHSGSAINTLIPAYAAICIYASIGFFTLFKNGKPIHKTVLYFLLLIQFVLLFYLPGRYVPGSEDKPAGYEFISQLSSINGDIYIYNHPYYYHLAGKRPYFSIISLWDIARGDDNAISDNARAIFHDALEDQKWKAILIDYFGYSKALEKEYKILIQNYAPGKTVLNDPKELENLSGFYAKPRILLFPEIHYKNTITEH